MMVGGSNLLYFNIFENREELNRHVEAQEERQNTHTKLTYLPPSFTYIYLFAINITSKLT